MKTKIIPPVFLVVLAILSVCSAEGISCDWAFAVNDGSVPVILHVKTGENKYVEIQLEPDDYMVLPAGSQKVTAFPVKGRLEEGEEMWVAANIFVDRFKHPVKPITKPGGSIRFHRPSVAVTPEISKDMGDDVVFAPGALAPEEEAKEEAKKEAPIDDKEFLREKNRMYMENKKRLEEIDPNSAEARVINRALKIWGKDIDRMTKEAENKYGPDWREQYRDSNGKLPGGLIEDDKSRLIKLKEKREAQQDKVDGLKSEFEELKKRLKPVESRWEDRLLKDQRAFREKFIEEHGESGTWDDETRKEYEEGFNNLTKKSKEQWEKDKAEQAEVGRAIGKRIKAIAQEQAELNQMNEVIERRDKRVAEKPSSGPAIPFVIGEDVGVVKPPSLEGEERKEEVSATPSVPVEGSVSKGAQRSSSGVTVAFIEGYAEDQTDGTIGYWNSKYPHPSFDDEEGRKGLPNGEWDGSYYFEGDTLYLVINNLHAEWPPLHTLSVGYTVTLSGGTFEDGSVTKNLIVYTYSGTPGETRIVKGFNIKGNR